MQQQRASRSAEVASVTDWEHYLACSPLPDPRDRPAMNDFLNSIMEETDITDLHKTMQQCEVRDYFTAFAISSCITRCVLLHWSSADVCCCQLPFTA
jgi:hypothetical protein